MAKARVYRVDFYDARNDEVVRSRRWFTREGAQRAGGHVIEDSATEIDEDDLKGEPWTDRDYNPHATGGFQRQVTSGLGASPERQALTLGTNQTANPKP